MKNIVSWSGGKDSTATVILAHEHGIPIDEIVMACLWFDKARGISAILPQHWEFITKVAKPKFQSWGYKVTFVDAKYDYLRFFNLVMQKSKNPERNGKKRGWVMAGRCEMTGQKQSTIKRIEREYADCISLLGIAIDEPERLERMHKRGNSRSLLEEYNYTEEGARKLCEEYNLLSPLYTTGGGIFTRDGCWFCPNMKIKQQAYLKQNYPELWGELDKLSKDDNLVCYYFNYDETFEQIDRKVDKYINRPIQCSLFD